MARHNAAHQALDSGGHASPDRDCQGASGGGIRHARCSIDILVDREAASQPRHIGARPSLRSIRATRSSIDMLAAGREPSQESLGLTAALSARLDTLNKQQPVP